MVPSKRHVATFTIPPKYDTSLFQRKGDCIEGMPIPIFQIIQEFLNEQDYRDLMNANLSTFQPIKYETVHYTLVGPERWIKFEFCAEEYKEATVLQIISSVKDMSKQIAMRFKAVAQAWLLKYAHLFDGIGKFTVAGAIITRDFSSIVFNKIRHLKLSDIVIVCKQELNIRANFDWENLEKLELDHCKFNEIVSWNSSKSLKKLTIHGCNILSSIPPLDDIPVVSITATSSLTHFQSKGNHQKFTCWGSHLDEATVLTMSKPAFCKDLKELNLSSTINRRGFYPVLPVVYGKELTLDYFSLASWNGQIFANILNCELLYCRDLIDFPSMTALQSFDIYPFFTFVKRFICWSLSNDSKNILFSRFSERGCCQL
jgi:hypothetical protein